MVASFLTLIGFYSLVFLGLAVGFLLAFGIVWGLLYATQWTIDKSVNFMFENWNWIQQKKEAITKKIGQTINQGTTTVVEFGKDCKEVGNYFSSLFKKPEQALKVQN